MNIKFFKTQTEFRDWLEENHNKTSEIWVGYYKKDSSKTGITWQESIDEALCYGWIDSTVRRVDEDSYANRFTPRRPGSAWSPTNTKRVKELRKLGLMRPPGLKVFHERAQKKAAKHRHMNPKDFRSPPFP